jgi:hypothetical protein
MADRLLSDLNTGTVDADTLIPVDVAQSGVLEKAEIQAIDVGLFNDDGTYAVSSQLTPGDKISFSTGMTEWADGLSNEEINRFVMQTGETLVVERIEFRQKGGGSDANASVRVYDSTAASSIGSQTLGGTTKDSGSSGEANTVTIDISNSTGAAITASVTVVGRITGA